MERRRKKRKEKGDDILANHTSLPTAFGQVRFLTSPTARKAARLPTLIQSFKTEIDNGYERVTGRFVVATCPGQ